VTGFTSFWTLPCVLLISFRGLRAVAVLVERAGAAAEVVVVLDGALVVVVPVFCQEMELVGAALMTFTWAAAGFLGLCKEKQGCQGLAEMSLEGIRSGIHCFLWKIGCCSTQQVAALFFWLTRRGKLERSAGSRCSMPKRSSREPSCMIDHMGCCCSHSRVCCMGGREGAGVSMEG